MLGAGMAFGQQVLLDAGSSTNFIAAVGATNYSWRLDGCVLANAGNSPTFSPGA